MTNGNGLLAGTSIDNQLKLEKVAQQMGARKYMEKYSEQLRDGQGGTRPEARRLRELWLPRITEAVQETVDTNEYPGEQFAGPILQALPAERIAAAALGSCLSMLMHEPQGVTRTRLLFHIARNVTAEVCVDLCKETPREEGLGTLFFDLCHKYRRFKAKNVVKFTKQRIEHEELFEKRVQTHLGAVLIAIVEGCSAFVGSDDQVHIGITSFKERFKKRQVYVTRLHLEVQELLHEESQRRAWLSPQWMPMVSDPKPFKKDDIWGGFHTLRYKWVSGTTPNQWKTIEAAAKSGQCDQLLDSMNASMDTRHILFKEILEMQERIWDDGGDPTLGIPNKELLEQLPRLDDSFASDPERLKDWKLRKSRIHAENIRRKSAIKSFRETLIVANMLKDEERLAYTPSLDFRGRSAPKAQYLSYIQDDVREALLLLAKPKDPGDEGRYWLMVHAAGLYGMDKLTFDERAQWTKDHMHQIARAVALGYEDDWWKQADKGKSPWQFLAACHALVNPQIAARLPVACDGTCNGLQHLSALTRDEVTGRLVNLVPCDRPQDQYADVTPKLKQRLEDAYQAENRETPAKPNQLSPKELLRRSLHWVTQEARDLVKQPVMTQSYNVTAEGMALQMAKKLKKYGEDEKYTKAIGRVLAFHLTPILEQSLTKPIEAMRWMGELAREVCGRKEPSGRVRPTSHPMSWITDLGFPVIQEYRRLPRQQIYTALGEIIVEYNDPNATVDLTKQTRGFAPNFIHSRDATHKWKTTLAMNKEGLDVWDKHDSFRTHACSRTRLGQILREEFVSMYKPDVIGNLHRHLEQRHGKKLPPPPPVGNLNIDDILNSTYPFK